MYMPFSRFELRNFPQIQIGQFEVRHVIWRLGRTGRLRSLLLVLLRLQHLWRCFVAERSYRRASSFASRKNSFSRHEKPSEIYNKNTDTIFIEFLVLYLIVEIGMLNWSDTVWKVCPRLTQSAAFFSKSSLLRMRFV